MFTIKATIDNKEDFISAIDAKNIMFKNRKLVPTMFSVQKKPLSFIDKLFGRFPRYELVIKMQEYSK